MNYILLLKILMKWSLESKEYELSYFIYTNLKIGIPNKYLYNISQKYYFTSLSSFSKNNDCIETKDHNMKKIIDLFPYSKFCFLKEWETFGYRYK
jgi:hypothetical protein